MGRVMFFLLRMAFWLGVVCLLLPGGGAKSPDAKIDATQAITVASAAVSDARGFCERQPDACVAGGKVAASNEGHGRGELGVGLDHRISHSVGRRRRRR